MAETVLVALHGLTETDGDSKVYYVVETKSRLPIVQELSKVGLALKDKSAQGKHRAINEVINSLEAQGLITVKKCIPVDIDDWLY